MQTAPPTSTNTVSPQPLPHHIRLALKPPPKKRLHRLQVCLYTILFGGIAWGGAVFYPLRSDNFHDFFTEYVPFGEELLLSFEERTFRDRYSNARHHLYRSTPLAKGNDELRVTIALKSGLSWKVQDRPKERSDSTQKDRRMRALEANEHLKYAQQVPKGATQQEKATAIDVAKKEADPSASMAAPVDSAAHDEKTMRSEAEKESQKQPDTAPQASPAP